MKTISEFNNTMDNMPRIRKQTYMPRSVGSPALGTKATTLSSIDPAAYSSSNIASTLVYRDANGNFACGTITGKTSGNESPLTFNSPLARSVNTISVNASSTNTNNYLVQRDGSGNFSASVITVTGITLNAGNIATDTTTGMKIGTAGGASGQKLGFFNQTPIVQPLLATGVGHTVDDIITTLQNLGLVRQS